MNREREGGREGGEGREEEGEGEGKERGEEEKRRGFRPPIYNCSYYYRYSTHTCVTKFMSRETESN